jgi:hypothetical protein
MTLGSVNLPQTRGVNSLLNENLPKEKKKPEDIIGEKGLLKQLTKGTEKWGQACDLRSHLSWDLELWRRGRKSKESTRTVSQRLPAMCCGEAARKLKL